MPVRNMLYDALQYAEQISQTAGKHRRERKRMSSGAFLSGFCKDDKLTPVITLVILFNPEPWEGPVTLQEMYAECDRSLLQFMPDYRINLMAPVAMSDEEINRLSSSLREVILFLKYAADKEKMAAIMKRNDRFKNLDRQAANVLNALTNCGLEIDEEEEGVDMCIAWEEMKKDARMEGEKLGIEKMCASISHLMTYTGWSWEEAMNALGILEDERFRYAEH